MSAFELQIEEDGLAVLTFDLPGEKVNKFSSAVVGELGDVLVRLAREARIRGLLVRSGKPDVFIAGADVKEFSSIKPEDARTAVERVQSLFEQLANLPYPTVAAINGACLGGGTEFALACDYRLMSDSKKAQIGLPEVRLGIFPAWGGCTRLPRTVGLAAALDLILTGKSLDARRARKIGLVDEAVPATILEDWSRRFARSKLGGGKPRARRRPTSLGDRALEGTPVGRRLVFKKAREGVIEQTGGHYPAPLEALEVVEESYGRPVADGLAIEARHIGLVFGGEVQRNLLNIFFLTEEVKKESGVGDPSVRPAGVARVGVLGAGVMGGGIAQLAADKGMPARMKDIQPEALAHGYAAASAVWKEAVRKRRLTPREMGAQNGPALRDARLLRLSALRGHDRGGRREARRQAGRPQGMGGGRPEHGDLRVEHVDAADHRDRRGRRRAGTRRRNALLQSRSPDAPGGGDPRGAHERRDGRDDLRAREDPGQDAGRRPRRPGVPRQPDPRAVPLRGRAARAGGLPDRGRGRRHDAIRHAGRAARAARRRGPRRRGQRAARCSRPRSPSA